MTEKCSVVVVQRDRFWPTEHCLRSIRQNTPESYDLIVVMGGAPKHLQKRWAEEFDDVAQFIFKKEFLNPAQARNIGMKAVKTRLAVLMDNDCVVWPNWLSPLLECEKETGAKMVVPVILEGRNEVHTAGNDLFISHKNGNAYGDKVLRFHGMEIDQGNNLKRTRTDYGELHCQLVEVETALRLNAYDENILEVGECDSGLTWQKAGCEMWFEPKSLVHYEKPHPDTFRPEDIPFFKWRWDMRLILEGYRYFEKKWGIDITEHGDFRNFLLGFNNRLRWIPRTFPCAWAITLDRVLNRLVTLLATICLIPVSLWSRFKAWQVGYYAWPKSERTAH